MATCAVCGNDYLRCNCQSQQPYCEQCSEDAPCNFEMDSDCVIYHPLPTTKPSKLENLGMPNGASAEKIFEAIDDFLGNSANVPITPIDTHSIDLTTSGVANHTIQADLKISPDAINQLEIRANGVYAKPYNENYLVKTDANDAPAYLEEQIVGGSDGIVSISVENIGGLLVTLPTLNVQALLDKIRDQYGDAFCDLVSKCIRYIWVMNTYQCETQDLDLITQKTINNLPEPIYTFEDGGRVYFVSEDNTIGSVWSLDPTTATTVGDITYLNETRTGQPYGVSGGTYIAGVPYRADASSGGSGTTLVRGYYYDKTLRTLFIHSYRSYGCDYYDFTSATWGKVSVGSTGSAYATTLSTDIFTHTVMHSNATTNFIITGWGSDTASRGRKVVLINKTTKTLVSELNATGSPTFSGITGNPFNADWGGFLTSDNRIFVARGNVSTYRNIAVFNSSFTPIIEIVPTYSTSGFNGNAGSYWQNCFIDIVYNKFYLNDFVSRKVEVYDTTTYGLLKTFSLDNNRNFSTCQVLFGINSVTQDLFMDLIYGGTSVSISDDAPSNQMISYKIDRSTLDIKKTYIGSPRAANLLALSNGDIITTDVGGIDVVTPTTVGSAIFYQKNPAALRNGIVDVLTLKQVNQDTLVPTGVTKPNSPSDPDYIAPHTDTTLCSLTYTLAAPSNIIFTATDAPRYSVDFGLNDDVVKNPALASIIATIRNVTTSTTLGTKTWTIPNTPNINAFFDAQNLSGITIGNTITMDIVYKNSSSVTIATYNNIVTVTAVAN